MPAGVGIDSFTGPVRVEWDREAALTALGQLSFFIDFLKTAGLFEAFVADCPLRYTSPNAPKARDVLGTAMLSILSGHTRYAHIAALRGDGVVPELTTHHRDVPDSVTITRERHAFEGQSLAAISSVRRRGVLLVLVVLPDGSRSLIPAEWTDWSPEQADRTPADDVGDGDHDLGRLGDLLHLRKVIDALSGRHVESAPPKESGHAIETGLPRPTPSCPEPLFSSAVGDGVAAARRSLAGRGARDSRTSDRPHALGRIEEGGKR